VQSPKPEGVALSQLQTYDGSVYIIDTRAMQREAVLSAMQIHLRLGQFTQGRGDEPQLNLHSAVSAGLVYAVDVVPAKAKRRLWWLAGEPIVQVSGGRRSGPCPPHLPCHVTHPPPEAKAVAAGRRACLAGERGPVRAVPVSPLQCHTATAAPSPATPSLF
jgi:hypothetical protein